MREANRRAVASVIRLAVQPEHACRDVRGAADRATSWLGQSHRQTPTPCRPNWHARAAPVIRLRSS
jgi:hypothetical protein